MERFDTWFGIVVVVLLFVVVPILAVVLYLQGCGTRYADMSSSRTRSITSSSCSRSKGLNTTAVTPSDDQHLPQ